MSVILHRGAHLLSADLRWFVAWVAGCGHVHKGLF